MTSDRSGGLVPDLDDTRASAPSPAARAPLPAATFEDDTVPVTRFARETTGRAVPTRRPATRRAPALRLRMPDGAVVAIDTTVILGRRPSTPRIYVGRAPRLIALPSPGREVSATHLEFRQVGETVVASDQRSTNGTIVTLPGSAPRLLLGGESVVVPPETLLDLGDGNLLTILSPEAPAADETSPVGGAATRTEATA